MGFGFSSGLASGFASGLTSVAGALASGAGVDAGGSSALALREIKSRHVAAKLFHESVLIQPPTRVPFACPFSRARPTPRYDRDQRTDCGPRKNRGSRKNRGARALVYDTHELAS